MAWMADGWGIAAGASGVYIPLYIIATHSGWGGEVYQTPVPDLAFLPLSLFAAIAAGRVAVNRDLDPHSHLATDPDLTGFPIPVGFALHLTPCVTSNTLIDALTRGVCPHSSPATLRFSSRWTPSAGRFLMGVCSSAMV
jgi:hypothetical protein